MITLQITESTSVHHIKKMVDFLQSLICESNILEIPEESNPEIFTPNDSEEIGPLPDPVKIFGKIDTLSSESPVETPVLPIPPILSTSLPQVPGSIIPLQPRTVEPLTVTSPNEIVALDADNLPWDIRIHSRVKSKTNDGRWRQKRGVEKHILEQVTAELQKAMTAPRVIPSSISPPPQFPKGSMPLPPKETQSSFAVLMGKITEGIRLQKITMAKITEIITSYGIPDLTILPTRPDLIPAISQAILSSITD